jgi:hypothetical protein
MQNPDYEKLYFDLVQAIGYDPELIKENDLQEKLIVAAESLNRVSIAMKTSNPEKSGSLFICGISGERDEFGLPEYISICPTYGLSGFSLYKKHTEYSEPGW